MKILVTGSAGFLGSHLVSRLRNDGHIVVGWDIVEGNDVCDASQPAEMDIEAIFHLACPVNPGNYREVALDTTKTSSVGTSNMLQLALLNKAKFLYVSSSEVYGHSKKIPYKESNWGYLSSVSERSYYGVSKRFGEMLTMLYRRFYDLDVRIVRPFNIYGPGMRKNDNRVIPAFMRQKKSDIPLPVIGKGEATRTFCYVDDFTEAIIRAMFYPKTNGEIFNLGTTDAISMSDLAKMISDKISFIPTIRHDEQKHRIPDISKAQKVLGWTPTTSLKKGLELTWKSYQ